MVLGKLFSGLFKKKESLSEPAAPIPAPRVIAVATPASSLPPRPSASNNAVANAGVFDDADLSPQQQGLGFSGEYEFIKELGKGATAVVKLCRRLHSQDSDNQTDDEYENLVALKEFKTSLLKKIKEFKREGRRMVHIVSTALDKVQVEIAIMKKLSHPNLVSLDAVLDDGSELLVLVLEYAPFGQVMVWDGDEQTYRPMLDPKILRHFPAGPAHPVQYAPNGFPEHLARMFFRELVDGLEYLHTNSICHRAFVADIWALGVTLYALLFGKLPYFAPDVTDLFDMIQSPQPVDVPESASVELRELLRGLLEKDPTKRMTFAEIRHHPWVVTGLAIDAVAAFQTRCHDAVEITEHDVEHALTKISSVSTITTMKVRGKKWAMKARQKTLDRNASSVSAKSEDDDVSPTPHDNIQAA
ncbi:hypothetical protein B5M09_006186 [Aphanomyces astaci]|uniref:Protein kinase domain-containing protein n=1 Tax=Aphanomyces astaci TaxID=112090 RepID=A0A3R7W6N9_APHAT|nr:hypothetical protein B5M09_006186 [Aphanomyces astaci]